MKCWQYVDRPTVVRNLPPYTYINDEKRIVPDIQATFDALTDGEIKLLAEVEDTNYRGLCLDINDHGNVTLYFRYKLGKLTEIWGVV